MFISSGEIIGCYWLKTANTRIYLPLAKLQSSTTILSTVSTTKYRQTYTNPHSTAIDELNYTFPLFDGVSVVDFVCEVGDRTIQGRVKERQQAKAIYQEAVDRGETAGLLEQSLLASDVFRTSVGNIPANASVVVTITYIGELKHDAEVNGVRFTIPTAIAPRYGTWTGNADASPNVGSMEITVDVAMPEGSAIQKIQSPSHPISVSIGTLSNAKNEEPSLTKGSATLTRGSTDLDSDFVVQVATKDVGTPKALLESHPTITGQRAIMTTLVPRFSLKPIRPEIIFCVDRSGSMQNNIPALIDALKVFLKSLSPGVKFNICSFGSHYSFLWPKSKAYGQETLDQAVKHVSTFAADYGGTETYKAIEACFKSRYTTLPTEVMLLTDGEIWQQEQLIQYVKEETEKSKGLIRVFTLGIGDAVSHALIEGVARAGNGFSQSVMNGEGLDERIVRMLKGAVTPHITDYALEVKYHGDPSSDDDFEIVEKVSDSFDVKMKIEDTDNGQELRRSKRTKVISLFASKEDVEMKDSQHEEEQKKDPYSHLPLIPKPSLLQTPYKIPPLFPFSRSTVFLLMSPETSHLQPKSVVLRGTAPDGPLELEIPIETSPLPGSTIHQLAAKKAIQELEEGRGWIYHAKDAANGNLIKDKYTDRMNELAEREAVRLGVEFQVGGKWCSFVAVESNDDNSTDGIERSSITTGSTSSGQPDAVPRARIGARTKMTSRPSRGGLAPRKQLCSHAARRAPDPSSNYAGSGAAPAASQFAAPKMAALNAAYPVPPPAPQQQAFGAMATPTRTGALFGGGMGQNKQRRKMAPGSSPFSSAASQLADVCFAAAYPDEDEESDDDAAEFPSLPDRDRRTSKKAKPPVSPMRQLIDLQSPFGFWEPSSLPWDILFVDEATVTKAAKGFAGKKPSEDVVRMFATAVVVVFFERKLEQQEATWELIVQKARQWLADGLKDREVEVWKTVTGWFEKAAA